MHAYLVRLKENAELVGLFVSPNTRKLWDYVDECCSPVACEYVALPPGGLYLHKAGAATVPTTIDPDSNDGGPDWFSGATLSQLWHEIFFGGRGEPKWKPVDTDGLDQWLHELE
jgi:hypothetical protein